MEDPFENSSHPDIFVVYVPGRAVHTNFKNPKKLKILKI